jgi:hypothetical protein
MNFPLERMGAIMNKLLLSTVAIAAAISAANAANASVLYGSDFAQGPTSTLYTVNQSTGALTPVGDIGVEIGDLTNIGGTLVGINISNNGLYTINPTTGAGGSFVTVTGTRGPITSIAYNPVTNVLYGNTTDAFSGSDILYTIDPVTGAATTVGGLSVANLFGLGFGQTGSLFATTQTGNVYSVDPLTGTVTLLGAGSVGVLFDVASRPEDNVLFAGPDNSSLVTLNPVTGAGTTVGPFGSFTNIAGLAFLGGAVPEPSTWAMMLLGFGAIGVSFRRSRKVAAKAQPA